MRYPDNRRPAGPQRQAKLVFVFILLVSTSQTAGSFRKVKNVLNHGFHGWLRMRQKEYPCCPCRLCFSSASANALSSLRRFIIRKPGSQEQSGRIHGFLVSLLNCLWLQPRSAKLSVLIREIRGSLLRGISWLKRISLKEPGSCHCSYWCGTLGHARGVTLAFTPALKKGKA